MLEKVEYQGLMVSIATLGKLSKCSTTSLYRAFHNGFRTGDELVVEVRKHLIEYKGEYISIRKLCLLTDSDYKSVKRRLKAGIPAESAILDLVDRRGAARARKLSASDVLEIYMVLFRKEKTQASVATDYDIHQSTISDIWRHRRWGWLVSPLRYQLELNLPD